jgi:hypothetical protein
MRGIKHSSIARGGQALLGRERRETQLTHWGQLHLGFHASGLQTAGAIFGGDVDLLSVKAVMRKLSRGVVRRGRASSTKASVVGAAAGLKAKGKKGGALTDACLRAMESLRQEWIAREMAKNA